MMSGLPKTLVTNAMKGGTSSAGCALDVGDALSNHYLVSVLVLNSQYGDAAYNI